MMPYERLMAILSGKKNTVDRIPCINSVSVSTVEFMKTYGAYWPAAHRDSEKMAKLASAAYRSCSLEIVSVPFCMTVEAEVLGAKIDFHENTIKWPSVRSFQVKDLSDLKFPEDISRFGRIPIITEAIKILKDEFGGKVPVNAYIVPPFTSLSSYLVDSITFLKWLRRAPEKVHDFCKDTLGTFIEIAKLYKEAGADVITFHEMGASTDNISPNHFEEFVKPYLKEIIRQLDSFTILNICGSAEMIVDKMVECGANAVAVDERTPIKEAREKIDGIKPGYPLIGNVSSYGILHQGPVERIREAVKNCIEDGVDIMAPGCDFWLETPTKNIRAFVDACIKYGSPPPWNSMSEKRL
jgi:[methyl-Co(III) methanol-specific corrinoid protein]:coenzyme M methyltransferase